MTLNEILDEQDFLEFLEELNEVSGWGFSSEELKQIQYITEQTELSERNASHFFAGKSNMILTLANEMISNGKINPDDLNAIFDETGFGKLFKYMGEKGANGGKVPFKFLGERDLKGNLVNSDTGKLLGGQDEEEQRKFLESVFGGAMFSETFSKLYEKGGMAESDAKALAERVMLLEKSAINLMNEVDYTEATGSFGTGRVKMDYKEQDALRRTLGQYGFSTLTDALMGVDDNRVGVMTQLSAEAKKARAAIGRIDDDLKRNGRRRHC